MRELYTFPEIELERYKKHGIARVPIGRSKPVVSLQSLEEIAQPLVFWERQRGRDLGSRRLIIASDEALGKYGNSIAPHKQWIEQNKNYLAPIISENFIGINYVNHRKPAFLSFTTHMISK